MAGFELTFIGRFWVIPEEKGDKRRTIGLHYNAAQAIKEYIDKAEITSGPLFRPRLNPRSGKLAEKGMDDVTLYRTIQRYLEQLSGAVRELLLDDGGIRHSLRLYAAFASGDHRHIVARCQR